MVSLCQCYCKIQVLVLQALSAPAPLSQRSFGLVPFDVSALLSLPLGDFSGVSPARPLPCSGVPRPKVPGCPVEGGGEERSPQGRLGLPEGCTPQAPGSFRCSRWTLRPARRPWRCCAALGPSVVLGEARGRAAAPFQCPLPSSHMFLTAAPRGGYSPPRLSHRKQRLRGAQLLPEPDVCSRKPGTQPLVSSFPGATPQLPSRPSRAGTPPSPLSPQEGA